jgi:peptide/nickel transport system permease protein
VRAAILCPGLGLIVQGRRRLGLGVFVLSGLLLLLAISRRSFILQACCRGEMEMLVAAAFLAMAWGSLWLYSLMKTLRRHRTNREKVGISHWQITMNQFRKNKLAVAGLVVVVGLYATAFLSPLLASFDPDVQEDIVRARYLPPLSGLFSWTMILRSGERIVAREIREEGDEISFLSQETAVSPGAEPSWSAVSRSQVAEVKKILPSRWWRKRVHWLGTDKFGRDILSRIIYGSRISLSIGFVAMGIAITLGTLVGAVSGYYGKAADNIIMRMVDMLMAFPRIFLVLTLIALFRPTIWLIIAVLGATGWMGTARLVRGQILSLKEEEFIQAAHALGIGARRIIFRHILPNAMAPIIVTATLMVGSTILVEAALSFLGLGVQPPTASWGNIINQGRDNLLGAWWIATFPGLAIVLTVVAYNLFGDGLRDALDPRLRD